MHSTGGSRGVQRSIADTKHIACGVDEERAQALSPKSAYRCMASTSGVF